MDIRLLLVAVARARRTLGRLPWRRDGAPTCCSGSSEIRTATAPVQVKHVSRERSVMVNSSAGDGRLVGDVQRDIEAAVGQIRCRGATPLVPGDVGPGRSELRVHLPGDRVRPRADVPPDGHTVPLVYAAPLGHHVAAAGRRRSLGAMALTYTPFTLFSLLGFTLLIGLVGKNAILLIDYTATLRRRGKSRTEAITEAGPTRLRPIIMTTLSVIVALMPLAAGLEEASELLKSAAIVLIGGLATSTLLTLVFVPAMYTIFDDLQVVIQRGFRKLSRPVNTSPRRSNSWANRRPRRPTSATATRGRAPDLSPGSPLVG